MSDVRYDASRTGLLLVDPYNDFLSDGGKLWPMVKDVADEVGLLDHLGSILAAARAAGIRVFFVPHRRWEPGDYEDWDHPNPSQRWVQERQIFAKGTWGGEHCPHSHSGHQRFGQSRAQHWPGDLRGQSLCRSALVVLAGAVLRRRGGRPRGQGLIPQARVGL
jgi:Isochorismatase family